MEEIDVDIIHQLRNKYNKRRLPSALRHIIGQFDLAEEDWESFPVKDKEELNR